MAKEEKENPSPHPPVSPACAQNRPGPAVTVIGVLTALWAIGFAAVNLVFEITGHFSGGIYIHDSSGLSVMDWLVTGLKVTGAAIALLSILRPKMITPSALTVLLWGAFATLALYVTGSIAEAIGMALHLIGGAGHIDIRSLGYVLFFLTAAVGYGVLAISYSRRHPGRKHLAVLGLLGAPVLLGLVLVAVPALLAALGLLPSF